MLTVVCTRYSPPGIDTDRAAQQFAMLQSVFLFMQQDLTQAVDRGVRDEFGDSRPPFSGGDGDTLLAFVHGGAMGMESVRMALQPVAYVLMVSIDRCTASTSEHRSMYSYVRLSIDRCTATYV